MYIVESQNERGDWFVCDTFKTRTEANEAVRAIRADGFEARVRRVEE